MIRALMVAAALLVAVGARPAAALPDETWLVVVGNNEGAGDDVTLRFAEQDARNVAEVFRERAGVSSARVTMVLAETADALRAVLERVDAEVRRAAGASTALVVYYSGHADADALRMRGTTLPVGDLRALVEASGARVQILIVDACRSGAVTRVKGVQRGRDFRMTLHDELVADGIAIITSSTAGETSQESDRLRGSFFSHHFVNAMRGAADKNDDGRVTLGEAYAYTYDQTVRSTGRTLAVQHPTYAYDVKGRGEVVLAGPSEGDRRLGRLKLGAAGRYLVSEERGESLVAEVVPPRAGATLALAPRRYQVQHRGDDAYREYAVALEAGGTTDLASAPHRTYRYDRLVRKRGGEEALAAHGVYLLGGGRGAIVDGGAAAPQLVVGYGVDLPWFTVGARVRGSTVSYDGAAFEHRHHIVGAGLTLQRFVDFRWLSVGFGVLAEGTLHRQSFAGGERTAPDATAWGGAFGGLFAVERVLWDRYSLRVEGGPMTEIFEAQQTVGGEPGAVEVETPLTWWAAAGVIARF